MRKFGTFNQFDHRFQSIEGFNKDRNACPIFALYIAYHFLKDGITTKSRHENVLEAAVETVSQQHHMQTYPRFQDIIPYYGGYHDGQVKATTPELINQYGYINFDDDEASIFKFPGYPANYAVVFLKNSNFIVVLVKFVEDKNVFCVRDCHEKEQYDFDNFEALTEYLNKTYQFNNLTIVDGVLLPEYSNIEYLKLEEPFEVQMLDPTLDGPEQSDSPTSGDNEFGFAVDFSGLMDSESDEEDSPSSPVPIDVNQVVGGHLQDEDARMAYQLQMRMWQEAGMDGMGIDMQNQK